MRNDPATSGTMKLLEAILRNSGKPESLLDTDEARREAKRLDEKAQGLVLCSRVQHGPTGKDDTRRYLTQGVKEEHRGYFGRCNQKRKGLRRNHEEARAIARMDRDKSNKEG